MMLASLDDLISRLAPDTLLRALAPEQLEHLLASMTAPKETAAILIESVLGEGGYVVPPPGFLSDLSESGPDRLAHHRCAQGFARVGRTKSCSRTAACCR